MIAAVGDRRKVKPPAGARVIDGRGKFLIPGLIDVHVHLMEEGDLHRFLAYGVTTVRNLTGSPQVLEWRRAVEAGKRAGPRIVTSGPLFAGPAIPWREKVVPAEPAAARAEVRRQKDAGYDLIKIYDGLAPDVYAAIVDEAAKLGMPVTGHIPEQVHLARVLAARQSLEHTDKLVFDVWGHSFDTTRIDRPRPRRLHLRRHPAGGPGGPGSAGSEPASGPAGARPKRRRDGRRALVPSRRAGSARPDARGRADLFQVNALKATHLVRRRDRDHARVRSGQSRRECRTG